MFTISISHLPVRFELGGRREVRPLCSLNFETLNTLYHSFWQMQVENRNYFSTMTTFLIANAKLLLIHYLDRPDHFCRILHITVKVGLSHLFRVLLFSLFRCPLYGCFRSVVSCEKFSLIKEDLDSAVVLTECHRGTRRCCYSFIINGIRHFCVSLMLCFA